MANERPSFWIVAGPNGSGKSSLYGNTDIAAFNNSIWIINPDLLTRQLQELESLPLQTANLQAVTRIEAWLDASIAVYQTIGVETVLSTVKYRRLVTEAKQRGFAFRLIFVMLESVELNIERVRIRVEKGGHDVPEDRIRSRWTRSLEQLPCFSKRPTKPLCTTTRAPRRGRSAARKATKWTLTHLRLLHCGLRSVSPSRELDGMIIAIDGPAASGKGTLGKRLAAHYGLRHLDTGLLYRAVAKAVLDAGKRPNDENAALAAALTLDPARFDAAALKAPAVGEAASIVSAMPQVRAALLAFQREFAATPPGAVLDGRDIGTVICPDADVKIFVTARPEVRARRRALEFAASGRPVNEAAVLADIKARDARDTNRAAAPLKQAADAHLLDTSEMDISSVMRAAIDLVEATRAGRGRG